MSLLTISHFLPIIIISRSMPLLFFIAILIFPQFSPSLPISLSQPHFVYLKHMLAFLSVISLYLHLSSFFPTLPFFFPYFPITVHPSLVPSFIPAFVPSFVPSVVPSFFPSFLLSLPHPLIHPSLSFLSSFQLYFPLVINAWKQHPLLLVPTNVFSVGDIIRTL